MPGPILDAENPCKNEEEFTAWRVLRRIGAVGLLWDKNSTAFLGIDINAEKRKKILESLTAQGKICPVAVQGIKQTFYYLSGDDAGILNGFEETAVRSLTEKVMNSDYPRDLPSYLKSILE